MVISVVIPTCNRPKELQELLDCLSKQDREIHEIIVIDSSDKEVKRLVQVTNLPKIDFIKVDIKSAAFQRNIGMSRVNEGCVYLCFLDDDVKPSIDYLSKLIKMLEENNGVGISGIAVNPRNELTYRQPPRGMFGAVQRFFQLDSIKDGKLLKSGVNIPVRTYTGPVVQVEWLIGCSIWKYKKVLNTRFESDFKGVSLNEDVIFSLRASKFGKLLVDPSTHLWHTESDIGRQKGASFWEMWVVNRKRLVEVMSSKVPNYFYFHLANFGQFLSLIYSGFRNKTLRDLAFLGIIRGYGQLFNAKRSK